MSKRSILMNLISVTRQFLRAVAPGDKRPNSPACGVLSTGHTCPGDPIAAWAQGADQDD